MEDLNENITDYDYEFEFDDYNQHIIVAIAFIIASVLGIFGNSLVILSVFASNKLRTVTNAFVVNLSVADLVTSLLIPWNALILLSHEVHPIADWGCAVAAGVLFTCVGCSLFTLASIAVNRLLLITRPIGASRALSPVFTGIWIAATWVLSFLFNIVPPLVGIGELGTSQKYRVCAAKSSHPLKDYYDYIQAVGCFPIPLLTLTICYIVIFLHLRQHSRKLSQHDFRQTSSHGSDTLTTSSADDNAATLPTNNPGNPGGTVTDTSSVRNSRDSRVIRRSRRHNQSRRNSVSEISLRRREHRITKNMFIVFLAFFICIIPFALTLVISDGAPLVPYATALILMNACINPILYGFKHPTFKRVFKCLLTCRWHRVPEPSSAFKRWRSCFCSNRK